MSLVPDMTSERERLGSSTRKDLHVLCYQHHTEMLLRLLSEPAGGLVYACQKAGCLVRYDSSQGYFLDTKDAQTIEQETTPHLSCSNDGLLMYLAEVMPERRSFRRWKCPEGKLSYINDEETLGRAGKKDGSMSSAYPSLGRFLRRVASCG
jgi:hypothetical protein